MKMLDLVRLLQGLSRDHRKRVFTLKEVAILAGESRASTGMALLRAAKKGVVARVGNLWMNLLDSPDLLEVALSFPWPSYLSFEAALYRHGLLSQSPRGALTLATTGRTRLYRTPLGIIRFIHLQPALFFGFDDARVAYPEKAWLDLIYVRGLKGRKQLFSEEWYLDRLDPKKLKKLAKSYPAWLKELCGTLQENVAKKMGLF